MQGIRYLVPALLAVTALAQAQDFGALSSCGQNCVNNMRIGIGCVPVTDQCICGNANFQNGVRDCANQSCTAPDAAAAVDYADSFCRSVTGTPAAATAAEAPTTPTAPPTTDPKTTTTATTPTDTTSVSSESVTPGTSTTSAATTQTSPTTSATASGPTATSYKPSATKPSTATSSSTRTSAAGSASSTADVAAASPPDSGLSVGAKAGIAVAAGAAAVAVVALAIALFRTRRRRPLPRGTMQISEPLPGSGRLDSDNSDQFSALPQKPAGSKLSPMTELDSNARRYEDMLPRVSPRRMV